MKRPQKSPPRPVADARKRVLTYLYEHAGTAGVSCYDVGYAAWGERPNKKKSSVNGGGDYAAQMLLGRLKAAGLVEHAPSEGSTRWRLSLQGRREIQEPPKKQGGGAIVGGTDPCSCGCSPEGHGRDPVYPGSTACTECSDCIAYEACPAEVE